MKLDTMEDLLVEQLEDLYTTEKELIYAYPKLAQNSYSPDLKKTFEDQSASAKDQLHRLDEIYSRLGLSHKEYTRTGTSSIISKGEDILSAIGNPVVKDAALIAAAQRVEHYEMAGYGSARSFANELGYKDIAKLLQDALNEEHNADKRLSRLAEGGFLSSGINKDAPK